MASEWAPDWVMVGWRADGRYWLLASKELDKARMDWVARRYDFSSWEEFLSPGAFRPAWHIDVIGTGNWVLVNGDSYAACLADLLFKHGWRADQPDALEQHDPIRGHLTARRVEALNAQPEQEPPQ